VNIKCTECLYVHNVAEDSELSLVRDFRSWIFQNLVLCELIGSIMIIARIFSIIIIIGDLNGHPWSSIES
jgi:hypothetical protein